MGLGDVRRVVACGGGGNGGEWVEEHGAEVRILMFPLELFLLSGCSSGLQFPLCSFRYAVSFMQFPLCSFRSAVSVMRFPLCSFSRATTVGILAASRLVKSLMLGCNGGLGVGLRV